MLKPNPPLALQATIPYKATAITIGGGAGDATRVALDLYVAEDELMRLLKLRGERLLITLMREDDVERASREDRA